jgi:predicted RNA-binding protein with PIN domain
MHYWIDGYNLLFRFSKASGSFEDKRRSLIFSINEQIKTLSLTATLVFDASDPLQPLDRRTHYDSLEIIYTPFQKSADDVILEAVEISSQPSNLCVVSSDKPLCAKARALGASTLSLSEFLFFLSKRGKRKKIERCDFQDSPQEIARLLKIFTEKNPP